MIQFWKLVGKPGKYYLLTRNKPTLYSSQELRKVLYFLYFRKEVLTIFRTNIEINLKLKGIFNRAIMHYRLLIILFHYTCHYT
jgi:hypothetical protein